MSHSQIAKLIGRAPSCIKQEIDRSASDGKLQPRNSASKKPYRRYGTTATEKRGRILNRRSIHERSAEKGPCLQLGHYEVGALRCG